MRLNPAQQIAQGIADELAKAVNKAIAQKGAQSFASAENYRRWRAWCDEFIRDRLVRSYGSKTMEDTTQQWLWHCLGEYDNLCHNLPLYSITLLRTQNGLATDLLMCQPATGHLVTAALGAGAHSTLGRCRVSKLRKPSPAMLYAGQDLPGNQRNFGAPLLEIAMVADGQLDAGCWPSLGGFLRLAAALLLQESGGLATDSQGNRLPARDKPGSLLIANPELHSLLLEQMAPDSGE